MRELTWYSLQTYFLMVISIRHFGALGGLNATVTNLSLKKTNFYSAILSGGAVQAAILQTVVVTPDESYALSASFAKVGSGSIPQVSIYVYYYDASYTFLSVGLTIYLSANTLPDGTNGTMANDYELLRQLRQMLSMPR